MIEKVIELLLAPIGAASITYFFISKLDAIKKDKSYDRLGIAVLGELAEEIKTGISLMESIQAQKNSPGYMLPSKAWRGMETISNEIFLRILAVAKNQKTPDGFPVAEIRTHCKNYFEHIVAQSNHSISQMQYSGSRPNFTTFIEAAKKLLNTIGHADELLKEDTRKVFTRS